ncbi:MAG: hypothetical protein IT443_07090 [Phycisphaeraceae bacterium]|nr:hypothetical protein [Phycisphaeraceae bacterium]
MSKTTFLVWVLAFGLLSLSTGSVFADTVEMKDGSKYDGKFVSKDDHYVVFEVQIGQTKIERRFPAAQVVKLTITGPAAPPAEPAKKAEVSPPDSATTKPQDQPPGDDETAAVTSGPSYLVIPIRGEFGVEVDPKVVQRCLDLARRLKPDAVILDIHSPGGSVRTLFEMMDIVADWQSKESIRLVAFVRQEAFSAAALFALSVKDVYMMPGSAMGAALVISISSKGIDDVAASGTVGEKFASAFRAKARTITDIAGHDPLIAEAMIDPQVELWLAKDAEGKPVILRGPVSAEQKKAYPQPPTMMVAKGKLLTLTANEAVDAGVIAGIAANYDELGRQLQYAGWKSASNSAEKTIASQEAKVAQARKRYEQYADGVEAGFSRFLRASSAELPELEASISTMRAKLVQIEKLIVEYPWVEELAARDFPAGLTNMKLQCDKLLGEIREYKAQMRRQGQRR